MTWSHRPTSISVHRVCRSGAKSAALFDAVVFPGGVGHGGAAGFGGELLGGGEAGAVVAEFREDLGGIDGAAAGEALDKGAIGMLGQRGRDGGGELLELSDERREDGDRGLDEFPAGLGLRVVGTAQGSAARVGEQLGRGAPAAVGMALEPDTARRG